MSYPASRKRGLKPWPKGVSGNPSGRPKKPISEAYAKRLLSPKQAEKVVDAMFKQASKGNVKAVIEITDRVEGKVTNVVEGTLTGTILLQTGIPRPKR